MTKNKSLILFLVSCFLLLASCSHAADFIAPNSSGEPIVIDVSNLNVTSSINVSIGDFLDQPRSYRDENTGSIVIFPPSLQSGEKTISVRSGSSNIIKTISLRPSLQGTLKSSLLPELNFARGGNTATKISDGRVVIIGGSKGLADNPLNSIEVFNPESGKSEELKNPSEQKKAKLQKPRGGHTATYIGITKSPVGMITGPVEQILVVGGFSKDNSLEKTIEIVEIKVGTLQGTSTLLEKKEAKLKKGRVFHTASLLPDGRVLIVGGQGRINPSMLGAINSIEIFDPVLKQVQSSPISLSTPRILHTATTLQNGNILIAGGFTNEKQTDFGFGPATEVSELIETKTLTIKRGGSLVNNKGLGGHTATLLTNSFVLICGGSSDFFSTRTQDEFRGITQGTVQFFNPTNETFNTVQDKSKGGNLELKNPRFLHQTVLLPNANIAIFGGLNIMAGLGSNALISTPVSTIEVINVDTTQTNNTLAAQEKQSIESTIGRILPTAILVTPKDKTYGFLNINDANNFVNAAIYLTGGFTNGLGKLPSKVSEFLQIESESTIEGRKIKLTPEALVLGSYLSMLFIELSEFSKVPALKAEPQTVNLSSSNNFMASIKVLSTNNETILLNAKIKDSSNAIIVSPSLFQVGESITISRKDNSTSGEFEIEITPNDPSKNFINATLKVNISDSAKPILSTVPPNGLSLSTQEGFSLEKVQVKVLSQDGLTELTSIPPTTQITATISNPEVANLGTVGVSSVTGTIQTQFTISGIMPGKTSLNFSTSSLDALSVSIPVVVSGTPSFSNNPIDSTILTALLQNGIEQTNVTKNNDTNIQLEDLRLSPKSLLFPIYVPINLTSSIDSSDLSSLFTIRPVFGVDLQTALPRTLTNKNASDFRSQLGSKVTALGGIGTKNPIAIIATDDGLRKINYETNSNVPLNEPFKKISKASSVKDIKLFEFSGLLKAALVSGSMLVVLDIDNEEETTTNLSSDGFDIELTSVDNQLASVVAVGIRGIDLLFPLSLDTKPRNVTNKLPGITKKIKVVEKLIDKTGPFAVAYDSFDKISIVDIINVATPIETISTEGNRLSTIDYAGRFSISGKSTDVLVGASERKLLFFDLNNLSTISTDEDLKIKSEIEDLIVIDGVAYLALGNDGILAVSIGSLLDGDEDTKPIIAHFKKIKLQVIKPSSRVTTVSKSLNASKLANSNPFLLATGENNDLVVIRVVP